MVIYEYLLFLDILALSKLLLLYQDHGVNFFVEGQERLFRGSIGPFSDDNLGAHAIGGFIKSFFSLRVCRNCMGTNGDIQTKVYQQHSFT